MHNEVGTCAEILPNFDILSSFKDIIFYCGFLVASVRFPKHRFREVKDAMFVAWTRKTW